MSKDAKMRKEKGEFMPGGPLIFPSLEWFQALQQLANADPAFQRLGNIDTTMGMKVGSEIFLVTFRASRCEKVEPGIDDDLFDVDFYLEMDADQWQAMLENIKENGGADADHTLSTLDQRTPGGIVSSDTDDQSRADYFFRFNQSLQYFFNLSAQLDTTFDDLDDSAAL
jgi:hypothetical protein